jgi:hypothetical protein
MARNPTVALTPTRLLPTVLPFKVVSSVARLLMKPKTCFSLMLLPLPLVLRLLAE